MIPSNIIGQGNPYSQSDWNSCAIKSQQIILKDFGIHVSEQALIDWSIANGLYDGSGTRGQDVGKILAAYEIPITQKPNANIFDLVNELALGHRVIVGVDSSELYNRNLWQILKDFFVGNTPDHAVVVAGIDNTDPNNPMVLITDPGTGQAFEPYPLDKFLHAWQDSNCYMVSTDICPVGFMATQSLNSQPLMYLPEIAGVSYNDFQLFHDMANAMPSFSVWDEPVSGLHPVHSLVDAYSLMSQDLIPFSGLNQFSFYNYLDPTLFNNNYANTFMSNYDTMNNNFPTEMAAMQSYLAMQNYNLADAYNYFNLQTMNNMADNMQLADFFQQQVHYIDMSNMMGTDPMSTYNDFFFNHPIIN